MKWNHIKIFMIILLVLVNAFFAVTLYIQYHTTNYIPDSELQQLTALLSGGSVEVPEGTLPARKLDTTVYGGGYADSYYDDTVGLLSGGADSSSYITLNGMNFIMRDSGDLYEFTYPFGFKYVYHGNIDSAYALDLDREDIEALPKVDFVRTMYTLATIKSFLYADGGLNGSDTAGALRLSLKADSIRYDSVGKNYIAQIVQYAGKEPVNGCSAIIAVNGNMVVYVSGNLILCNLNESYNAELRDQVNLLLAENRDLSQGTTDENGTETASDDVADGSSETESSVPAVSPTTSAAASAAAESITGGEDTFAAETAENNTDEDGAGRYILTSAEGCYCISWNTDRTKFYLLPGWKFTYNGSVVRIRNAVNGSIYTK